MKPTTRVLAGLLSPVHLLASCNTTQNRATGSGDVWVHNHRYPDQRGNVNPFDVRHTQEDLRAERARY